ncbi:probable G-protein coupled receptor 21 [Lineus longissimus]|uniref:probable G-protein coupled receptor 21 n=1 Tax=Lineus longissimus TaxID=88925 RepID=UPI00315C59D9
MGSNDFSTISSAIENYSLSQNDSSYMHKPGLVNVTAPPNCSDFGLPECDPEILYVIPMTIITLAIIFGNVLILLIFYRIHNKTCLPVGYLNNLAVADLGVGACNAFFCLPLVIQGRWPDNHIYSDAIGFIINTFSAVSATTLGVVSIDRYLYVSKPLRYHSIMTKRIKVGIIIVLWLVSAALGLPGLFGLIHYYYDEHAYLSYVHFTDSIVMTVIYCGGVLLPVTVTMVVCYVKIYVIARRHMKEMRERGYEQKPSIHVVTTLVLTVLCFVLCWTPYAVHHFVKALTKYDPQIRLLDFGVTWLAGANSCANCVIYWLRQTEVRNEVRSLLCRACCAKAPAKALSNTSAYLAIVNGGPVPPSNISVDFDGDKRKASDDWPVGHKPNSDVTDPSGQENELQVINSGV